MLRRAALTRRTPLKRRARLRPRRDRPRRRPTPADPEYLARVRTLRCAAPHGPSGCHGAIEAHHAGPRGLGQRADDRTAIPLCRYHHRAWHDGRGVFADWAHEVRAVWVAAVIAETQRQLEDEAPTRGSA